MVRYDDMPKPPADGTVAKIEAVQAWLKSPNKIKEPKAEDVKALFKLSEKAAELKKEIEKAYTDRVSDKSNGTVNVYMQRLKQINDTASLIASAYTATTNREALLGLTQ